jgi:transcriptional regulator with XRE-family HTH domain
MSMSFRIVKLSDLPSELKYWREKRGLSQKRMAKRAGYNLESYNRWERGLRNPRIGQIKDWAQALGFDLQIILLPNDALDPPGRASSEPASCSIPQGAGSLT